ncbi:MAG: hypothetical protein LBH51_08260, partial [Treponema sp.]|nr:hypothetical protein [Treponema sp.]
MTDPVHTSFLAGFFRRRGGLLLLLPVFLSLSRCGTAPDDAGTPPVWDGSPPAWELNPPVQEVPGDPPPGIAGLGVEEREIPDEISATVLPPEAPEPAEAGEFAAAEAAALPPELFRDMEEDWELPEASPLELAESVEEPRPPPEPPLAALPEPLAPIFADPVPVPESPETGGDEPETVPEAPEPVQREAEPLPAIQEDQEVPAQSPEQAAPPPPVPPLPPPYIRPAEEYEAPPVREAPAPSRIPDPPARREEIPEPRIVYSRVVRAVVGQLVEVPFQGTGWVYLGELGSRPGIVYGSRRLDPEGQSFIFRTEAPGTYGLRFYKQDFIRDYILNDFVQVVVGEPPEAAALGWFNPAVDRGRAVAEPRWPSPGGEDDAPGGNSGAGIRGAEDSRTGRGVLDAVLPERIEAAAPSTGSPAATDPPPDGGEAPEGG